MKTNQTLFLLLIILTPVLNAQSIIEVNWGGTPISFENESEKELVYIEDTNVWIIGSPQKDILFIPGNYPTLGDNAIYTDTASFYANNLNTFIQFKIQFGEANEFGFGFEHKYDFELNHDGGIIETSHDNGVTWQNILYDSIIQNNLKNKTNFYDKDDTISSYNKMPGFTGLRDSIVTSTIRFLPNDIQKGDIMLVRFIISSDDNQNNNEGWMLDDITFFGVGWDNVYENNFSKPSIYPNPVRNEIIIESTELITRVDVFNLLGEALITCVGQDLKRIDTSLLKKGVYLVKCSNKTQSWTMKINKL